MSALSAVLHIFSFQFSLLFFHGQPGSTAAYWFTYSISDIGRCRKFGSVSCTERGAQWNDFELFIIKIVHRVHVKRKQIQTQKDTKIQTHTHKKEESEINPKDESRNQPVHSILNISAQSSGLSLNNKKSFRTETFTNSSADTLDR